VLRSCCKSLASGRCVAKGSELADDDLAKASPVARAALASGERASGSPQPRTASARPASNEAGILHGKFRVLGLRQTLGDELVYKALHLGTGRRVELHMLAQGVAAQSPQAERMLRAARAAGRAPHSNILNVVDSGLDAEQRPFVVYEQFAGISCRELVAERGPCDLRLATEIIGQVLDGLTALHERGVYHRCLRAEHVVVDGGVDDLRVKMSGLGHAGLRNREDEAPALPRAYSRYLAPEARRGEGTLAPAIDIYAAGVLLRFLLTGEAGLDAELPPQIELAVARATAEDRDERFQTAEQFRACLSAITGPTTRASIIPSGSLLSDLRFMVQRRSASEQQDGASLAASGDGGLLELYPVLLVIEALYARIGADGWRALLAHVPELEQLLPAAGNSQRFRTKGVASSLLRAMLGHADELSSRGNLRLVAELGEELARRGLGRFCAGLPAQLTPEGLVACVPALWRSIAREGEVVLIEQRTGLARLSVRAQRAPSLELSALFAGLLRGQLRMLAPEAEVNLLASEALGEGADILVLSF